MSENSQWVSVRPHGCNAPLGHFAITAPIVSAPAPLGRILPISLLRHHMVSSPSAHVAIFPLPSPPASLQLRLQKRIAVTRGSQSECLREVPRTCQPARASG
jgi:hypothetical protein